MKRFILFAAIAVMMLSMTSCVTKVGTTWEGVKVSLAGGDRGITKDDQKTGWVFYNPIVTEILKYPTHVVTVTYKEFTINAKDGSEFFVDPTINLYVEPGYAYMVCGKYLKPFNEIVEGAIYNYVKDAFRVQLNSFTTNEIISRRNDIEVAVAKQLSDKLGEEHIKLDNITSGLKYPATIVAAVDAKNKAQQVAMQKENEILAARADSAKMVIAAAGEKVSNELKQKGLNSQILQQMWIEKWKGDVPTVSGSSNGFILNLNDLK